MRILYHHRTQALDGQRVHIREIQDSLRALGHEVVEVAPVAANEVAGAEPKPTFARRVLGGIVGLAPRGGKECLELAYNLVGYRSLCRAIRRVRPDVIYERYTLNTVAGTWAARKFGLPLLLEVNAPLAEERRKLGELAFPHLGGRLERKVLHRATRVLAVTGVLARIIAQSAELPADKVVVIQNGVRPERFAFSDAEQLATRQKLGVEDALVVGAVGFFREWHGIDLLLDCIAGSDALRGRVRLVLVGDGPAVPKLREQATRIGLGDRVVFTGSIPHDRVPPLVSAMDVVLLPRAVEYASPLKLFEYMAASKAIVAPRQENLLEVLTEGADALCFTPENAGELSAALHQVAGDAALRQRLGGAARATIDRLGLTWDGNAARIVAVAEEVLEQARHANRGGAIRPTELLTTGAGS